MDSILIPTFSPPLATPVPLGKGGAKLCYYFGYTFLKGIVEPNFVIYFGYTFLKGIVEPNFVIILILRFSYDFFEKLSGDFI